MSSPVTITRGIRVPDPLRIARCLRAPELGPRILFFSGGSALRPLSRTLKQYTHNSIHLITAFDSGGSSAHLRRAFAMPSIGDLRNRIVALADESVRGNPQIYKLTCYRLPLDTTKAELEAEFKALVDGSHPLVAQILVPLRQIVMTHLSFFAERKPESFDLSGANIGNLILAGGFLANSRDMDSVLFLFSKLLEVRGIVRPIVNADLHLCAELENGSTVVGQHKITGKEHPALQSSIKQLRLVSDSDPDKPASIAIHDSIRNQIERADLICLPMGSFYSSVVANLLPKGAGAAIAHAACPRIYIPNMGHDPEQRGMSLSSSLETLQRYVSADAGASLPLSQIVNLVLLDQNQDNYNIDLDVDRATEMGVSVIQMDLASSRTPGHVDPTALSEALISLV